MSLSRRLKDQRFEAWGTIQLRDGLIGEGHRLPLLQTTSALNSREGLVPGQVHRDRELEAGDLQNAADLIVLAAEHQNAAVFAALQALPGADDEGDAGGIDELALGEVDQDRSLVAVERLVERALEFGSGAEVELATNGDRSHSVLELADFDLEGGWIHGSMLPQEGDVAPSCFAPSQQGKHLVIRDSRLCSPL